MWASLQAQHPDAKPAEPPDPNVPALQVTLEQLRGAVDMAAQLCRGTSTGLSGCSWTFKMICAAYQTSNAANWATLAVVSLMVQLLPDQLRGVAPEEIAA